MIQFKVLSMLPFTEKASRNRYSCRFARGFKFFSNRSYTASRVLMLISDGGLRLILELVRKSLSCQIGPNLYLLDLFKGRGSPGLSEDQIDSAGSGAVPEFFT